MADFDPRKLFVGGIPRDSSENALIDYFSRYGEVLSLTIAKDRLNDTPRGFGFVIFSDPASADRALSEPHEISGKKVEVKRAIPRSEQLQFHHSHGGGTSVSSTSSTNGDNQFRTRKIFVGGLPADLTEEEFKAYFEKFGGITDVVVMHDNMTNRPRGFGFVTFESEDTVEEILKESFYEVGGKQVEVKRAIPKDRCRDLSNGQMSWADSYSYWPQAFQYCYNGFYSAGNLAGFGMPVVATVNPWNGLQMARYVPLPYNSGPGYQMNSVFGSGTDFDYVTGGARSSVGNLQMGNLASGVRHSAVRIREIV